MHGDTWNGTHSWACSYIDIPTQYEYHRNTFWETQKLPNFTSVYQSSIQNIRRHELRRSYDFELDLSRQAFTVLTSVCPDLL